MLALQQLISEKQDLPTIFFDEIDTGVSGDVALKMGQLLEKMGETVQLMAISHLPQAAARSSPYGRGERIAQRTYANNRSSFGTEGTSRRNRTLDEWRSHYRGRTSKCP